MAAGSSAPELATAVIGVFVAKVGYSSSSLFRTSRKPLGPAIILSRKLFGPANYILVLKIIRLIKLSGPETYNVQKIIRSREILCLENH